MADTVAMIFPSHAVPETLFHAIDSLAACTPAGAYDLVIVANDAVTIDAVTHWTSPVPGTHILHCHDNPGHLGGVNRALDAYPWIERFCYLAKDVVFEPGWLEAADAVWQEKFPDDLGLIAFNDDLQAGLIAAHGLTSRAWLRVVYGTDRFPTHDFFHYHIDSQFSEWSKDLGRYEYAADSHVHHEWKGLPIADHQFLPDGRPINDKAAMERRGVWWRNGEREAARERLRAAQAAAV